MLKFENTDYDKLARILSGEATSEELVTHEQWLASDPLHQQVWAEVVQAWNISSDVVRLQGVHVDDGWGKVKGQIKRDLKPTWYKQASYQWAATVMVLVMAASALFLWVRRDQVTDYREIIVNSDGGKDVVLPDGSVVTLHVESQLVYSEPFNPLQRLVKLKGEAFFQVEGNQQWPFIIETDDLRIRVTGTSFNVRSRQGQKTAVVDVTSGKVEVMAGKVNVLVTPGLSAVYNRESGILEEVNSDLNYLSWKTRRIEFRDEELNRVFETLENVYRVKIVVSDGSILNERLGATFSNHSLDYITGVVCATFNLECTNRDDVLWFSRNLKGRE